MVRLNTPSQVAKWLETEAVDDTVIGVAGKITPSLLATLNGLGFSPGDGLAAPAPSRYWLELPGIPPGKPSQQAILCSTLAAQWWQGLADPILQFQHWLERAEAAGIPEPNAMTLATTSSEQHPSARMVLLKEANQDGFVFYTNYGSQKARELSANPRAALVFFWPALSRQVRITGRVAKTSRAESESYFHTRPRGSQLAAWASWQSSAIPDRAFLEARVRKLEEKYRGVDVPLPPNWGGYRLRPESIEFWQGRPNRLHDRLRYSRQPKGNWKIERLAP